MRIMKWTEVMIFAAALCAATGILVSCAAPLANPPAQTETAPAAVPPPVSPEAKIAAQEQGASVVATITFAKGSAQLTPSSQRDLEKSLAKAQALGKVEAVKVISWADGEYPSAKQKQLSKPQRQLAERRNANLKKFFKGAAANGDYGFDAYNMAERPGTIADLMSTSDARLKRSLEQAGMATTAYDLRFPENASKAVVMLILASRI